MSANRAPHPALLIGLILSACSATSPAPKAYRLTLTEAQRTAQGAWTHVSGPLLIVDGELLAVTPSTLTIERKGLVALVPTTCAKKITVAAFEAETSGVITGGVLGSLSTVTHGVFLPLSLPIWLLAAGGSTSTQSAAGYLVFLREGTSRFDTESIRKWARFPQGLPQGYLETAKGIQVIDARCSPPAPISPANRTPRLATP